MNCTFCAKRLPDDFKQTNYGKACSTACATGGVVNEVVKCALNKAPCIGHHKKYCAALNDLLDGKLNPDIQSFATMIQIHASKCAGGCKMFHSVEQVLEHARPPPPPPVKLPPPVKRRMTVADAARVCIAYQTKHDPSFGDDLKSVMRKEGFPGLQHLLDKVETYTADNVFFHTADFSSDFTIADIARMVCIYRFERVHLSETRNFTMDMKAVMRAEGVPEMQSLLDIYTV